MSAKDTLKSLKLSILHDKRYWAGAAVLLVAGVLVTFSTEPQKPRQARRGTPWTQPGNPSLAQTESYRDLITAIQEQVREQKREQDELQKKTDRLLSDYRNDRKQFQGIFESLVDKIEDFDRDLENIENRVEQAQQAKASPQVVNNELSGPDQISNVPDVFGYEAEVEVAPPPLPPRPLKVTFVSPGDSVPVKLLTGVNAPVDGTPYPVVFKLNGPITGPDGSSLNVGEARLIAAAQGSESDGRVLYRLADLAIRHKDGRRSIVKVDGWIVGEDGVRGMKGKLIDKLGRLIAATAGVAFASSFADRIDQKARGLNVNDSEGVTIDGDDLDFSGTTALTTASDRLGDLLIDRYEKLVPVVEVLSGREVVAIFSSPAEVEIFDEYHNEEAIYASAALD